MEEEGEEEERVGIEGHTDLGKAPTGGSDT
jgi:hypothetical protein